MSALGQAGLVDTQKEMGGPPYPIAPSWLVVGTTGCIGDNRLVLILASLLNANGIQGEPLGVGDGTSRQKSMEIGGAQ